MKCPVDGTELAMSDRQGVEIDYCPKCRGVWLDRGELDKIIERSPDLASAQPDAPAYDPRRDHSHDRRAADFAHANAQPSASAYDPRRDHGQERRDREDGRHDSRYGKKKGLLSELFDF